MNRYPQFKKTRDDSPSCVSEVVQFLPFEIQSEDTVFAVLIRVGEHYLLVPINHKDAVKLNGFLTEAAVISDGDCI